MRGLQIGYPWRKYYCSLDKCPYAESTAVMKCIYWLPDGTEVRCNYLFIEDRKINR